MALTDDSFCRSVLSDLFYNSGNRSQCMESIEGLLKDIELEKILKETIVT